MLAAVGGMIMPAMLFILISLRTGDGALQGLAIPTATDIAFALAVLAVISTHLPAALRTFLLTLAVVDDVLAIMIIALFYTTGPAIGPLLQALIPLAVFTVLVQRRTRSWWLLLPLAFATWALIHASGVHATVAGILLGFAVPVLRSKAAGGPDAGPGPAEHFEHRFRPISSGFAVPVFAFFAAGVTIGWPPANVATARTHPLDGAGVDWVARIWERPAEPEAPAKARISGSDSTIVWSARNRLAKLSRKQAQRHSTDEKAKGANQQPVAPEPAAALVVGDGDTCFHRQN